MAVRLWAYAQRVLAACAALVLLVLGACAPEVHEPAPMAPVVPAPACDEAPSADNTPDDVAAEATPSAPSVAVPADLPQWPSVAWILTQGYETPTPYQGVACGRGQRAFDNPETLFVSHPDTGRCSFRCVGPVLDHTAECETIDGYCDAAGWCVSIWTAE